MAKRLNLKQKAFCRLYTSDREFFGNGVQSYAEAYDIDISTKSGYKVADTGAYRMLTNVDILEHINKLLDDRINDQFVDKQLAFLITQNAELHIKLGAIKEYNLLKHRVKKKLAVRVQIDALDKLLEAIDGNTRGKPSEEEIKRAKASRKTK